MPFKKGDIVKVKQGLLDPDFGGDIGGWQGKVSDVDGDLVCVDWDKTTLFKCPEEYIQRSEEDGLDWEKMYLSVEDVEAVPHAEGHHEGSCKASSQSFISSLFRKFRS